MLCKSINLCVSGNTMRKLFLLAILIHSLFLLSAQLPSDYKKVADQFLTRHLDSAIMKKVKYKTFTVRTKNGIYTEYGYNLEKSKIRDFEEIEFEYSCYSTQLRHTLLFLVAVTQTKIITDSNRILRDIPDCALKNYACGLIPGDSAITIAKRSKIDFPGNLITRMELNQKSNEFIWVITGSDPKEARGGRARSSSNQTRYINAVSGDIINWNDFHK